MDGNPVEGAALQDTPDFAGLKHLTFTRNVFREALRLYPPVPMMVRETTQAEHFRDRDLARGAQIVISPWHLHRHERIWDQPDEFDPDRYETANGTDCLRDAFLPFSAGARVCPGAGFAMIEGPLLLALLVRTFAFNTDGHPVPVPTAYLTVRSDLGIWLTAKKRT